MSVQEGYFTKNFFKNVVQTHFKSNVNVLSVETSNFLPPGENYCCMLLRVSISYSEKNSNSVQSLSVITKTLLDVDVVLEFDEETGVFHRELTVYRDILPRIEKLGLVSLNSSLVLGQKQKVSAKAFYLSEVPKKVIILEDLSTLNYKMANRQEGLDLDHCLLTIQKLAYYHAASLAIYEKDPKLISKYNKGMFHKSKAIVDLVTVTFEETLKTCQREPSLQKYAERINLNLLDKSFTVTKRDPKFNVLNHGDFWCNNLMFKYKENGCLEDVLFVDFQMAVFASPFFDLHSFFATSTNMEVKEKHINTVLNCYYHTFCKHAKVFKLTTHIPNRKEFNKEFLDKAYIGFTLMSTYMPFIKANNRKDASFVSFMQNDCEGSFRHHCYNNESYLTSLKCLLAIYDNIGLFDN